MIDDIEPIFKQHEPTADDQRHDNRYLHQKRLINVDEKFSQAQVPKTIENVDMNIFNNYKKYQVFSGQRCNQLPRDVLEDYLSFAQSLFFSDPKGADDSFDEKKKLRGSYSGDGLILNGLTQTEQQLNEKALNFLQRMNFNVIKAKFYLLQPTLISYNQYRHQNQLNLTDEYMQSKIEQYICKVNEDKISQQTKWRQDVTDHLNSKTKVHLNSIHQFLEQAQQLKYDIPDQLKNIYQQAIQIQKQLTKIMKSPEKLNLEQLKANLEKYEEQLPVITTEIEQLRELIQRSEIFVQKLQKFPIPYDERKKDYDSIYYRMVSYQGKEKGQLKSLSALVQESKNLPVEFKQFELVHKKFFDYCQDLTEKISKFIKIQQNKTRLAHQMQSQKQDDKTEKLTLKQAEVLVQQIQNLMVTSDDFENFLEVFNQAILLNQKASLNTEDQDTQQKLLQEVMDCPFYLEVQEKLQSMIDYQQIMLNVKDKIMQFEYQDALNAVNELLQRGIINDDLQNQKEQLRRLIEWNQLCDNLLENQIDVTLLQVYEDGDQLIEQVKDIFKYDISDIKQYIDSSKLERLQKVKQQLGEWKSNINALLYTNKKQQKPFQKLWDLFKEGLNYRSEFNLINQVRAQIIQIIEWYAQVYIIKQNLKISMQLSTNIDNIEEISKIYIQRHGIPSSMQQISKLQNFQSQFLNGAKDLQIITELFKCIEKWVQEAEQAILSQNHNIIDQLLRDAQNLPVNERLVEKLRGIADQNKKLSLIQQTLTNQEPIFEDLLQILKRDEDLDQMRQDQIKIYKRKNEDVKLSTVAVDFYAKYLDHIMFYMKYFNDLDKQKLQQVATIKLGKLKEIQKEIQSSQSNLINQIEELIQQYSSWVQLYQNLNDQNSSKKKKKFKDSDSAGSQQDSYQLNTEMIFYFKVPEMLWLIAQGIKQNFICEELMEMIFQLIDTYQECLISQDLSQQDNLVQCHKLFMPHFFLLGKKLRLVKLWSEVASTLINSTPRLKNLLAKPKLLIFIDYVNKLEPKEQSSSKKEKKFNKISHKIQKTQSEEPQSQIQQEPDSQEQVQVKSKRIKQPSIWMKDDNMTFYDPNMPLKKAFGHTEPQTQNSQEQIVTNKQLQAKRYKRSKGGKVVDQESEFNIVTFLENFKQLQADLLQFYGVDEQYCICRQGSVSAITDFKIIKCMDEKNIEQFDYLHTKQSQQQKLMIECDNCEEWFHQECVGIKIKNNEKSDNKYMCRACVLRLQVPFIILKESLWDKLITADTELYDDYCKYKVGLEKQLQISGEYISQQYKLPTLQEFKNFVNLGSQLPSSMLEYELLEILDKHVDEWSIKASKQNLSLKEMIQLYQESQWFPILLQQSETLLMQICQTEFITQIQDILLNKTGSQKKSIRKQLIDKTEQLYIYARQYHQEQLTPIDHELYQLIQAFRIQSDMNSQLLNQVSLLKRQGYDSCEQFELLIQTTEQLLSEKQEQCKFKFMLPKLNELKISLHKLRVYDQEVQIMFNFQQNIDVYVEDLSNDFYDRKPAFVEVQAKIAQYDNLLVRPSPYYDFLQKLSNKVNEIIDIFDHSLIHQNKDQQFETLKEAYKLRCKVPNFTTISFKLHKDVQIKLLNSFPQGKFTAD